jgi:hypothetical protein
MIEYYPLLARAVSGLATESAQARQEVFEHARTVLIAHLRKQDPQILTAESIVEQIAFEAAVLKLEAEWRSTQNRSPSRITALRGPDDMPEFASLLRQLTEVWPAPDKLLASPLGLNCQSVG